MDFISALEASRRHPMRHKRQNRHFAAIPFLFIFYCDSIDQLTPALRHPLQYMSGASVQANGDSPVPVFELQLLHSTAYV